jgi:hypothetical protein
MEVVQVCQVAFVETSVLVFYPLVRPDNSSNLMLTNEYSLQTIQKTQEKHFLNDQPLDYISSMPLLSPFYWQMGGADRNITEEIMAFVELH